LIIIIIIIIDDDDGARVSCLSILRSKGTLGPLAVLKEIIIIIIIIIICYPTVFRAQEPIARASSTTWQRPFLVAKKNNA